MLQAVGQEIFSILLWETYFRWTLEDFGGPWRSVGRKCPSFFKVCTTFFSVFSCPRSHVLGGLPGGPWKSVWENVALHLENISEPCHKV